MALVRIHSTKASCDVSEEVVADSWMSHRSHMDASWHLSGHVTQKSVV